MSAGGVLPEWKIFTLADKIKVAQKCAESAPFAATVAEATTIALAREFDSFMEKTSVVMQPHFEICEEPWPVADPIAKQLSALWDKHIEDVNDILERFDTDGWLPLVELLGPSVIDWAKGQS